MEVILRRNVSNLGKQGDVVTVADGYARNYLLPQRLAYRFTEGVRRQVETEARAHVAREERERSSAEALADRLRQIQVIRFERRVGETGHLYGSVTNADIADALREKGIELDRRQIKLAEPIKRLGTHRIDVHVFKETDVELAVEVEPLEGSGS
jgi:large subunit ribosomal protein L9